MYPNGFDDNNIRGLLLVALEATFAGSYAAELGMPTTSNRASEDYGFLGSNSALREWVGERQAQTLNKKQFTITNKEYEATMAVLQRDLERDKTGMLQARLQQFAADAQADHWQGLLKDLIIANGTCYDGAAFFSASHSLGDSGTQKNLVTSSTLAALNVASATAPTPTEMANAIMAMTGHMLTFKNDKGRLMNGQAKRFHIQVATPELFSAVTQALNGGLLTGNVDNPLKGMQMAGFTYGVSLEPRLTSSTDMIYMYRTDAALKPFILQSEREIEIDVLGKGSDFYFKNRAVQLGLNCSRAVGYGMWEYAIKAQLD